MKTFFIVIMVLVTLGLVGLGVYFQSQTAPLDPEPSPQPTSVLEPTSAPTSDFSWEDLQYIEAVDWPPEVRMEDGPYSCIEAGDAEERAGQTEEREIQGKTYCVTEITEGAAGSVYYQYAYATEVGDGAVSITTFSIREVQCGNYDEPQMGECQEERAAFNIDAAIAPFLQSQ